MSCFFLIKHGIATCYWPLCVCSPLLLRIQVPLSCCTTLMLSGCFRTMTTPRDLAVGCLCISFPQQLLSCSCPCMKVLLASLLSLVWPCSVLWSSFRSVGSSGAVRVTRYLVSLGSAPHRGSDTRRQAAVCGELMLQRRI